MQFQCDIILKLTWELISQSIIFLLKVFCVICICISANALEIRQFCLTHREIKIFLFIQLEQICNHEEDQEAQADLVKLTQAERRPATTTGPN